MKKKNIISRFWIYLVVIAFWVICELLISQESLSPVIQNQLIPICCWVTMAVSLNLVVGISGELSLGHAGFMSLGAFSGLIIAGWLQNAAQVESPVARLVLAMLAGGLIAGIFGFLIGIPVLRLRGDYLAIVTLAFGEIINSLIINLYVNLDQGTLYFKFLKGRGLPGIPLLAGAQGPDNISKIALVPAGFILVLLTLIIVNNLIHCRTGRAIMATRDNRIAAESVGINVTKYKMTAFVTAAVLAGMAGAMYGLFMSRATKPTMFRYTKSIDVLVFVVMGGLGNVNGSVISAALLTILPEQLRFLNDYRMLIYAVVLILMMLISNNPLIRSWMTRVKENLFRRNKQTPSVPVPGLDDQKGGGRT
jgi:branched-chain amino acid transport system permease protein